MSPETKVLQSRDNFVNIYLNFLKISVINAEEELFDWEVTTYPLHTLVVNKLTPFLKLYETTAEFDEKYKCWMEGLLGSSNPDIVEQETNNIWRNFYKLEKSLKEVPVAQNIATKVKLISRKCNKKILNKRFKISRFFYTDEIKS